MTDPTTDVRNALSENGLLMLQDQRLPSVVTVVTGEILRSSWWSHTKGKIIFDVLTELAADPDVLFTKLVQRKVTLVHRQLWGAFLTVVSAREAWQTHGLSAAAQRLVVSATESDGPVVSSGLVVKELEAKLLAHTQQVHTETGRHEVVVTPWTVWARHAKVKPVHSLAVAKKQLEDAAARIGAGHTVLPWQSKR